MTVQAEDSRRTEAATATASPVARLAPAIRRQERFASVASTNDVIAGWLAAGEPEICVAVADEQTAGRGRSGRAWTAPPGAGLLLSLGFRPTWLAPDRVWRLAATTSLAMADAAEEVGGLPDRSIRLKWPNDLVVVVDATGRGVDPIATRDDGLAPGAVRKLAGVLGETTGLGSEDARAVVGIGLNADWRPTDFPVDLAATMTSVRAAAGDRPVDLALLLDAFLSRLETRIEALHGGRFDVADWFDRQLTTGREVDLVLPDGSVDRVVARGVDPASGALVVSETVADAAERAVVVGEIRHVRLAEV